MTPIEVTPQPPDIDQRALRVFLKAIELVGGPRSSSSCVGSLGYPV